MILDAKESNPINGGPSFSVRHRLLRLVWGVTWSVLASWTPAPLHRWRRFLLSCFGADVHSTVHVYGTCRIWYPPNLKMAARATLGPHVNCYCMAPIELGEEALVSQGAHLCSGTHDISDRQFQLLAKPITLEARVWVAADAFIGPGVHIGHDAVVGARAVVFKNVEPFGVYVGNPAKFLRSRVYRVNK